MNFLRSILLVCSLACALNAHAQQTVEKIVTNGELTPGKEFHLLLIHEGDQTASHIAAMLKTPANEMVFWSQNANVRLMHAGESQVEEHHLDLVQKHGKFPILALIQQTDDDGRGAVWCSASGSQIPMTEAGLASWLNTYYEANVRAAQQSNQLAVVAGPRNLQRNRSQGSYFLDRSRSTGAPPAYTPGGRRPLFNPQLDVTVPETVNTALGLNAETRQALIIIGGIAIICCLIFASSWIFSAVIIGHAMTDHDAEEED